MKYLVVVALTLLSAQDATRVRTKFVNVPYDIKMSCGDCIASGYNYLWKTKETGLVVNDEEYPVNSGLYGTTSVMCCEGSADEYEKYAYPDQTDKGKG